MRLCEQRHLQLHPPQPINRKRAAIEHQFILRAHQVAIDHRQASLAHPLAHHAVARRRFFHVIGRGIEHQQCLCAGVLGRARRLGIPRIGARGQHALELIERWLRAGGERAEIAPDVFADQHAQLHAVDVDHHRHIARCEVTLLVKHGVVGQVALAVHRCHHAILQHGGSVVAQHAGLLGEAHNRDQARHLGMQLNGDLLHARGAGIEKAFAQQQVFGRITAQCEFRCEQHTRALLVRQPRGVNNLAAVAGQIADSAIDLRQGHTEFDRQTHEAIIHKMVSRELFAL